MLAVAEQIVGRHVAVRAVAAGLVAARTASAGATRGATVPFFLVSLAAGLLTMWFQYHRAHERGKPGARQSTAGAGAQRAGARRGFYLGKILYPRPLAMLYPRWEAPTKSAMFRPTCGGGGVWRVAGRRVVGASVLGARRGGGAGLFRVDGAARFGVCCTCLFSRTRTSPTTSSTSRRPG